MNSVVKDLQAFNPTQKRQVKLHTEFFYSLKLQIYFRGNMVASFHAVGELCKTES